MTSRDTRSAGRALALTGIVLVILTILALGVLAACGGDSGGGTSGGSTAADDRFAGSWAPVEARLEIVWNETKSYGISMADGSYGGLEIEKSGDSYTVTLVGNDGVGSDPLPALATGDVLAFDIPVIESMPTKATFTVAADGGGTLAFGEDGSDWDFTRVDALATETE